jgi:hypothetical protein
MSYAELTVTNWPVPRVADGNGHINGRRNRSMSTVGSLGPLKALVRCYGALPYRAMHDGLPYWGRYKMSRPAK